MGPQPISLPYAELCERSTFGFALRRTDVNWKRQFFLVFVFSKERIQSRDGVRWVKVAKRFICEARTL